MIKAIQFLFILCIYAVSAKASSVVVLQYHHVSDDTPKSTSISPELFQQHLDYLSAKDFNVISLSSLERALKNKEPLPDKSVLITFDDGYGSIYDTAFPMLKSKEFPFTVFINIEPIENKISQFMNWEQLKEMTRYGATIANHSYSHKHLIRREGSESLSEWKARIKKDIAKTQKLLEEKLSTPVKAFAYPFGEFNNDLKYILKDLGFIAFAQHSGALSVTGDVLAIPRFPFGGAYGNIDDFGLKAHSLPMPVKKIILKNESEEILGDHVLPLEVNRPILEIQLHDTKLLNQINCFLSGRRELSIDVKDNTLIVQPKHSLPVGRSRINCTARSQQKSRYYWFSQPWIKKQADGSWYKE